MEAVSRMASPKQIEFLEDLSKRAEVELERPAESLTAQQAERERSMNCWNKSSSSMGGEIIRCRR